MATRIHMEEDAGKLVPKGPMNCRVGFSLVDLNRAGTPLMKSSRADIRSAESQSLHETLKSIVELLVCVMVT